MKKPDEVWDALAAEPLTEAEAREIERRIEAYRQDRNPGRPWREVLREIQEAGIGEEN